VRLGDNRVLARTELPALLESLMSRGYRVIGPTIRDGAIVYDEIHAVSDLPEGWTDEQDAGRYRLTRRSDAALFGYAVGPQSWKKELFLPRLRLWRATRNEAGVAIDASAPEATSQAFLGVRSCEIHALAIQDRVFLETDGVYRSLRERAFVVAVNCGQAGGTCFCVSMSTGPKVAAGFDLAMTEVVAPDQHYFVVEAGSERGLAVLADLETRPAGPGELAEAGRATDRAASQMGRQMDSGGVRDLLARNREHPRWDEVAARCLTCANCTLACPTCFCSNVEDVSDLTGQHAERWRTWDSCFTLDFSYLHGGSVRKTTKSRYRQWISHKLSTWYDQFGTSGCVGCGRCITWCPVGIDITEEVRAIAESEAGRGTA